MRLFSSITIPNSVTSIGRGALSRCTVLTNITVSSDNTQYSSKDGVLFNKNKTKLVAFPGGKSGSYAIPDSVTSIDKTAFNGCTELTIYGHDGSYAETDAQNNNIPFVAINPDVISEIIFAKTETNLTAGEKETLSFKASSVGGTGTKKYAVWYKKSSATDWTLAQNYASTTSVSIKPNYTGTYDVSVKVMDGEGTIIKKAFTIKVTA